MSALGSNLQARRDHPLDPLQVIAAIDKLQPQISPAEKIFIQLYPSLKNALMRGVTRKAILQELAGRGIKLHAIAFKKLYEAAEAKVSESQGEAE